MEFIQIAYCCIAPFLLIVSQLHYNEKTKQLGANLLATANVLLLFYGVFLMWQMVGLYHLANQAAEMFELEKPSAPDSLRWFFLRQAALIILPFFFLKRKLNTNVLLTITAFALLFWDHPVAIWNTYGLVFKIANYFCLFCSGYALLWLVNSLPYQSSPS